jgi:hypothetical protein
MNLVEIQMMKIVLTFSLENASHSFEIHTDDIAQPVGTAVR